MPRSSGKYSSKGRSGSRRLANTVAQMSGVTFAQSAAGYGRRAVGSRAASGPADFLPPARRGRLPRDSATPIRWDKVPSTIRPGRAKRPAKASGPVLFSRTSRKRKCSSCAWSAEVSRWWRPGSPMDVRARVETQAGGVVEERIFRRINGPGPLVGFEEENAAPRLPAGTLQGRDHHPCEPVGGSLGALGGDAAGQHAAEVLKEGCRWHRLGDG